MLLTTRGAHPGWQVDAQVKILCADHDLYLAEIGSPATLRVALGPRVAPDYDRSYWEKGGSGCPGCIYIHSLLQYCSSNLLKVGPHISIHVYIIVI